MAQVFDCPHCGKTIEVEADVRCVTPMAIMRQNPADALWLSVRAANVLQNACVETVQQLVAMSETDLIRLPNFGSRSLREVKEQLAIHGLRLTEKP